MFFRQVIHEDLGCASYLIADAGEAVVVDPRWDVDCYLALAEEACSRITHVVETHFHADHVSGRARLAAATGAAAHLPRDPARPSAGGLTDGDVITIGDVDVTAVGAPGHRPEHLAYLLVDRRDSTGPRRLLAGDSLLIGELARPDLGTEPIVGAQALFGTAHRLAALGEDVELWPGHVGGSLCGAGNLSDDTSSTIGRELTRNRLLGVHGQAAFVQEITRTVPARPPRVTAVVAMNERGVGSPEPTRELDPGELAPFVTDGTCFLDVRTPEAFDDAHVLGAINLPAGAKGLGTRAGWVTSEQESIVIVAPSRAVGSTVVQLLLAAGVWNIVGVSVADPGAWCSGGIAIGVGDAVAPQDLARQLLSGEVHLIDVRDRQEWREGHVDPSVHLPLSVLRDGRDCPDAIPGDRPLAVACMRGPRAAVAASVLRRCGHERVSRVVGGIPDLAGYGVELIAA